MNNFNSDYQKQYEAEYQRRKEEKKRKARIQAENNLIFYRDIGRFIQKHRERRKLSQNALARRIGCTMYRLADYENARSRISLHLFSQICNILEIDYDYCGGLQLSPEEKIWVEILRRRDTKRVAEWLAQEI